MNSSKRSFPYRFILAAFLITGCFIFYRIGNNSLLSLNQAIIIMSTSSIMAFFVIVYTIIINKNTRKNIGLLRPIVLFLISYIIVHYQLVVDVVLGISKLEQLASRGHCQSVARASLLSLVGLCSCCLAYSMTKIDKRVHFYKHNLSTIGVSTSALKFMSIVLLLLLLYVGRNVYFHMGYSQDKLSGSNMSYLGLLYNIVLTSVMLLELQCYKSKNEYGTARGYIKYLGVPFNLSIVLYLLAVLTSGDRGPVIFISTAYFFSASLAANRKLSFRGFFVILLVGAFVMSILGSLRQNHSMEAIEEQIGDAYTEVSQKQSLSPITKELAGSFRTLEAAVDYVPSVIPHTMGLFQFEYLMQVIPFSSRFVGYITGKVRFSRSTGLLTWLINGEDATSGVGTTCIADLYIDLGVFGVIIVMFLWGIVLRKCETLYYRPLNTFSLFEISLFFSVFELSFYMPRSALLFHLKDVAWLTIFLWLCSILHHKTMHHE